MPSSLRVYARLVGSRVRDPRDRTARLTAVRITLTVAAACAAASSAACGSGGAATAPAGLTRVATGTYLAATVAGVPVDDGESVFSLAPAGSDQRATYSYNVRVAPPSVFEGDVGNWSVQGDQLTLRSFQGGGTWTATLRTGRDGVPEVAFSGRSGRALTFRLARSDTATAHAVLIVAVVDAAGRQVGGATLLVRAPDGLAERFASSDHIPLPISGPPGEWTVTATPPVGYTFAPGQPGVVRTTARALAAGEEPRDTARVVLAPTAP